MRRFEVFSGYRQFYVADSGINPPAPEVWTDENISQRHNTLQHITALCPAGDITASVVCYGPGESAPEETDTPDFEVYTFIEISSGKIGVFGWPWELQDSYEVASGSYRVIFKGYRTDKVEDHGDYYVVRIEPLKS
jgi:hypothetical protein